jgi:hypothetical protein
MACRACDEKQSKSHATYGLAHRQKKKDERLSSAKNIELITPELHPGAEINQGPVPVGGHSLPHFSRLLF